MLLVSTKCITILYIGKGGICGYRAVIKSMFSNNSMIGGIPGRILKKDVA